MAADLRGLQQRFVLSDRIERMAQSCIDHPGLITRPEFDEFVQDLAAIDDDLAGAFVRTVHDGLAAKRAEEATDG